MSAPISGLVVRSNRRALVQNFIHGSAGEYTLADIQQYLEEQGINTSLPTIQRDVNASLRLQDELAGKTSASWRQVLLARAETLREEILEMGPESVDYAERLLKISHHTAKLTGSYAPVLSAQLQISEHQVEELLLFKQVTDGLSPESFQKVMDYAMQLSGEGSATAGTHALEGQVS